MADLGNFPIEIELPVAWGDMDALGHVNNTVYLRWFESARMTYFGALDALTSMRDRQIGPILARTSCNFRLAVKHPDRVRVAATIGSLGGSSFTMGYRITSEAHDWRTAADGDGVIVLFDYANDHKVTLPDELRTQIAELENSAKSSAAN